MTATGLKPTELCGCGFESRCSHLKFRFRAYLSKKFLGIQATIECGFTLKRVRDMIKTYNQLLYDLFKQEDLNSCKTSIYSLRLDWEIKVKIRRVLSKISKLYENNQYEFAMTKPLSIGIFKK